ncbi:MAG: phosphatase PAP2 family protein [Candidatus Limnocylindria bacterium]
MRRLPDPMSRLVVSDDAAHHLGGAVPSPAAAFLLAVIALPGLFWLVMLKRTTVYTAPEEWMMSAVVPAVHAWVETNLPPIELLIISISALGSGWFVALAFAALGLLALANGRRDLALLLALGTLAFPMEWALKYFTSSEAISLVGLVSAVFNVDNIGLDDIADFPAGHALRATVLYGIAAFCVARLAHDHRQGQVAYVVAAIFVGAISATRIYLQAHYPMDVLGGWMAGGSLPATLVAVHVPNTDERARARELAQAAAHPRGRRVAVPRRTSTEG